MSKPSAPLPARQGLTPSRLHLPPGSWPTLLAFLCERFAHVDQASWQQRLTEGRIFDAQGRPFQPDSPYPARQLIWYYREVAAETPIPFNAPVLYRDEHLIVADKPHFLASIPGGRHVHETLLGRLRRELALPALTPIHRLDRETAGVMLFCCRPQERGAYQTLFQQHQVQKEYEAIGAWRPELTLPMVYRSRLQEAEGHFRMIEVAGEANSETHIALIERRGMLARYHLQPRSGKKHQLRAHLAALGIGICGDPWYPDLLPDKAADDFSAPLCLLARAIHFTDPIDGQARSFYSQRTLDWPGED
ncbi:MULTISPECIES: pseudouridine synthase [unclassified Paludibacterium]|uniref:pseudouridine synthase n=1 Tax=unclassified Paludibacterium TaxID=2618429 RepID=UPI00207B5B02|nr:pseudouridine synthase [Paludibacterium sp. B53371]BEV70715.1 RluA family pseudouridine synthase [Paludibacterium sp. THUN1379]